MWEAWPWGPTFPSLCLLAWEVMESPGKSMPRAGQVSALRGAWAVQEDLAMAEALQQQEVSRHLGGNRHRNRQIREDIPQARQVQGIEEERRRREEEEHRSRMEEVAERDRRLAEEMEGGGGGMKDSYTAKRDELFAKNLHRIEQEYRERQGREQGRESMREQGREGSREQGREQDREQGREGGQYVGDGREQGPGDMSFHDLGGGLQYQDDAYLREVARPVNVTEEPLYMNERKEVGEADLWGSSPTFHIGVANSWTRGREREMLRTGLEARGFLGETASHNTSTETAGTVTTSRTSRSSSSLASTASEQGACGGAAALPDDFLGPQSLLSPEELVAAEAAEREFEQGRRDEELARRLQEQMAGDVEEGEEDQRVAREAQDREFARVLQAKEQAKARRAKERARQRKAERQREREESIVVADVAEGEEGEEQETATLSPRPAPPSRKPHMRATAIDSHTNNTYCTRQVTPEHSESEEPRYANIGRDGQPVAEEPILHLNSSNKGDG